MTPTTSVDLDRAASFELFYRREADSVYRALSLAVGDADLGREAADEALARAFQHWRKISSYDNPAGWTYRVGLNWARSRLKKRRREVQAPTIESWEPEPADAALREALMQLPLEARSVVVLRYLLDWSTTDVADALEIAEGTVKSRLSRALPQLHRILSEAQR